MLTVDVAAIADGEVTSILLVQRANEPFAGAWALPGGFVEENERVASAAARELEEETGLRARALELLGVYDTPGRDPRGWTVSVVFFTRVHSRADVTGADDASDARWFATSELPALAFDHELIVRHALGRYASAR